MKLRNVLAGLFLTKQLLLPDVTLAQNLEKQAEQKENLKEKYSLIIAPETYRDKKITADFDGGLKNSFLLNVASIYESQKREGYKPENIYILCADGKIDTSETMNRPEIESLTSEKYLTGKITPATFNNISKTIDSLATKIDDNDEFTFTIMGHGEKAFPETYIKLPYDSDLRGTPRRLTSTNLKYFADKIKAGEETYIIDACYSGDFSTALSVGKQKVFTSSTSESPSLISRIDSFSRYLHYAKTDKEADLNKDGKISWDEAFEKAEYERMPVLKKHEEAGHTLFGKYPLEGFYGQKYNVGD